MNGNQIKCTKSPCSIYVPLCIVHRTSYIYAVNCLQANLFILFSLEIIFSYNSNQSENRIVSENVTWTSCMSIWISTIYHTIWFCMKQRATFEIFSISKCNLKALKVCLAMINSKYFALYFILFVLASIFDKPQKYIRLLSKQMHSNTFTWNSLKSVIMFKSLFTQHTTKTL